MTGIEKIITDSANIKSAADKVEGLIKGLFSRSFEEAGEMLADQVRYRRFKNQVKIYEKAAEFLKERKINSEKVNLKVLAPLIEFSSYEEDENMQELWAHLIKNIVSKPNPVVFQQNCIEILNKISNDEARLLNYLFKELAQKRAERAARENSYKRKKDEIDKKPDDFKIDWFNFKIEDLIKSLNVQRDDIEIQIANLVALGTVKYHIEVDVLEARKVSTQVDEDDVEVQLDVYDFESVRITKLGYNFVEMCQ